MEMISITMSLCIPLTRTHMYFETDHFGCSSLPAPLQLRVPRSQA